MSTTNTKEIEKTAEIKEETAEPKNLPAEKEEPAKETFMTKAKAGIKKHGKTALKVVGVAALTVVGFALGVKAGEGASNSSYSEDDVELDEDVIDAPSYSEEYVE